MVLQFSRILWRFDFFNYDSSFNYKIPCSGEPRDAITQAFNLAEKPGKTGSVNLDYSDCTNGWGYIEQSYPKVRDEVLWIVDRTESQNIQNYEG